MLFQLMVTGKRSPLPYQLLIINSNRALVRRLHPRNMTTLVVVSIPGNTVIASALKMNVIN